MKQCEIGKCTNKADWHHFNYTKGIHINYCNDCKFNIMMKRYKK